MLPNKEATGANARSGCLPSNNINNEFISVHTELLHLATKSEQTD